MDDAHPPTHSNAKPVNGLDMAPLIEAFHASELPERIAFHPDGQKRKPAIKDLKKECALKEMIQYDCQLQGPKNSPQSKVVCEPVLRLFRQ